MGLTIEKQIGGRLIKKAIKKRVTKSITDKIIKKFAGEHGKAAAIRKFGKERVAKVKISTKKIGTPPSKGGYGGGQGDIIPSKPMTGKPHLLPKDKYPSDISGVSPHVPKGQRGMRKGGKITSKKDPYAEGTGIPSGQKGTPPPSIFKQKKKKIKKKGGGMIGSEKLQDDILALSMEKDTAAKKKWDDRGLTGWRELKKDLQKITDEWNKDRKLIKEHGIDAPRAKSFSTTKRKKAKVKKRSGGKITYRMTGGQVVAAGYDK